MKVKGVLLAGFFALMISSCGNGDGGDGKDVDTTETLNDRYNDDTTMNNVNRATDQATDTVTIKKKDTTR